MLEARDRLIVALDLHSLQAAEAMVDRLGDTVNFYKIGYQLAFAGGLSLASDLARAGKRVFLDLKLHDIGISVSSGVESAARTGATFLTVHAYPPTMRAAVAVRTGSSLRVLAVTVLTSYSDDDLREAGYAEGVAALALARARSAQAIGVDGIVCAGNEARELRAAIGTEMTLVTPGIRPAGAAHGDQKRAITPAGAIAAGADYLVVGRQIIAAPDAKAAAAEIIAEIAAASAS
jgi:orotidine-5'-phosphate decarboxylase